MAPSEPSRCVFATNGYPAGLLEQYRKIITPAEATCAHISLAKAKNAPYLSTTYNIRFAPDRVDYMNPRPDGSIVVGGGQWQYRDDNSSWYDTVDDSTLIPGRSLISMVSCSNISMVGKSPDRSLNIFGPAVSVPRSFYFVWSISKSA